MQHTATQLVLVGCYLQHGPRQARHNATHCNTLQHTATHCNALQHNLSCSAVTCNTGHIKQGTLQQTATYTLQHTATQLVLLGCCLQHGPHQARHTATNCNVLQHTATHCNTLQHNLSCSAVVCNTAKVKQDITQHSANHYITLQRSATHCNTTRLVRLLLSIRPKSLQHTATYCNTLQHTATLGNTLHHNVSCSAVTCDMAQVRHDTLQHTTKHCNTLQHTAKHRALLGCYLQYAPSPARHTQQSTRHTATPCYTLQHPATPCNTLQHIATHLVLLGYYLQHGPWRPFCETAYL